MAINVTGVDGMKFTFDTIEEYKAFAEFAESYSDQAPTKIDASPFDEVEAEESSNIYLDEGGYFVIVGNSNGSENEIGEIGLSDGFGRVVVPNNIANVTDTLTLKKDVRKATLSEVAEYHFAKSMGDVPTIDNVEYEYEFEVGDKVVVNVSEDFPDCFHGHNNGAVGEVVGISSQVVDVTVDGLTQCHYPSALDHYVEEPKEPIEVGNVVVGVKENKELPVGTKVKVTYQFVSDPTTYFAIDKDGVEYTIKEDWVEIVESPEESDDEELHLKFIGGSENDYPEEEFTIGAIYVTDNYCIDGATFVRDNDGDLRLVPSEFFEVVDLEEVEQFIEVGDVVRVTKNLRGIAVGGLGIVTKVTYDDIYLELAGYSGTTGTFRADWGHTGDGVELVAKGVKPEQ